jgi:hypothetical protein
MRLTRVAVEMFLKEHHQKKKDAKDGHNFV